MAEILGLGCTHWPTLCLPNERLTDVFNRVLDAPNVDPARKDPVNWPSELLAELGNDNGLAAAQRCGERFGNDFRAMRKILDDFNPDFVLVWGDDQYENFKEDIVPPFCILGYDAEFDLQPWADRERQQRGRQAEPLGREGRLDAASERPSRGGETHRDRPDRTRHRPRLCLQAIAPPDGARLYQYVSVSRLGPAGLPVSGRAVRDQLLRQQPDPRQGRVRPSVWTAAAGRRVGRPAVAASLALHGCRGGSGRGAGALAIPGRADRLVVAGRTASCRRKTAICGRTTRATASCSMRSSAPIGAPGASARWPRWNIPGSTRC